LRGVSNYGPLANESVTLTISAGKVRYSRAVRHRRTHAPIGWEVGAGTVAADGTIAMTGGFQGSDSTIKASYRGKFSSGMAKLSGKQIQTFRGEMAARACSMTISK